MFMEDLYPPSPRGSTRMIRNEKTLTSSLRAGRVSTPQTSVWWLRSTTLYSFRTGQGRCAAFLYKWRVATTYWCRCGDVRRCTTSQTLLVRSCSSCNFDSTVVRFIYTTLRRPTLRPYIWRYGNSLLLIISTTTTMNISFFQQSSNCRQQWLGDLIIIILIIGQLAKLM